MLIDLFQTIVKMIYLAQIWRELWILVDIR